MLDVQTRPEMDVSASSEGSARRRLQTRLGYAYIAAFAATMYAATAGPSLQYSATVLPSGDPFTYALSFFNLLDISWDGYWAGIQRAFEANWYWMMNVPIALLSPFLVKEPYSLSIVNFICWALATASFYRLARRLDYSVGFAIVVALVNWVYPVNFGFLDYTSIPVVALDAMFLGLLTMAAANLLVFAVEPLSWRNAVLAGFTAGLAIWGRGNSVIVVGMVAFVPALAGFFTLWKLRPPLWWGRIAVVLLVPAVMTAAFFLEQGPQIANYYYGHLQFVERHTWTLHDAAPYLKNVPGFFFWRAENAWVTIALTWFCHLAVAMTPVVVWRLGRPVRQHDAMTLLALTGVFIYYVTYVSNIALFTDPLMNIYNALLIWAPMRIGMTTCAFAVAGTLVSRGFVRIPDAAAILAMALMIAYGAAMTQYQTPKALPGVPTPRQMEAFNDALDRMEPGASVSVLWYRQYSPRILQYYRAKNDLPVLNLYMNKYFNDIWQQYIFTEEKRMKVREEITHHFEEAGLIIIPEYVDYYSLDFPYSFYQFRDEFPRYLNSPATPQLVVRALIQEGDNRLMVLERATAAKGRGEPLKLPYGPTTTPHADYGPSVPRF
jgi:hypothetical protein